MRLRHGWLWIMVLLVMGCDSKHSGLVALGQTRMAHQRESQGTDPVKVGMKCENWGYRAAADDGRHSACVAMGMADYCGTLQSNTINGTIINIHDRLDPTTGFGSGIHPFPTSPPTSKCESFFEGAWKAGPPDGRLWGPGRPLCLSKKRWATMPLHGPCQLPSQLLDPRVDKDGRYCEDIATASNTNISVNALELVPDKMALDALEDKAALIYDYSYNLVLALHQWSDSLGHYYLSSDGAVVYDYRPPPAGYTPPQLPQQASPPVSYHPFSMNSSSWIDSFEGVVFTRTFYDILGSWDCGESDWTPPDWGLKQSDLVPLMTYKLSSPGDGFITTTENPPSVLFDATFTPYLEGYIYASDPATGSNSTLVPTQLLGPVQELRLYYSYQGNTYVTTTKAPPPGFSLTNSKVLGYALASL